MNDNEALVQRRAEMKALVGSSVSVGTEDVAMVVINNIEKKLRVDERNARLQIASLERSIDRSLRAFWRTYREKVAAAYKGRFEAVCRALCENFADIGWDETALGNFSAEPEETDIARVVKRGVLDLRLSGAFVRDSRTITFPVEVADLKNMKQVLENAVRLEETKKALLWIRGRLSDVGALERHARASLARFRLQNTDGGDALLRVLDEQITAISDNLDQELSCLISAETRNSLWNPENKIVEASVREGVQNILEDEPTQ